MKLQQVFTASLLVPMILLTAACSMSISSDEDAATYRINYLGNSNTGGLAPADEKSYQSGGTAVILGNTGNLERTGYSYSGWNTRADGGGTTYTQGQTCTVGTSDIMLYARWTIHPTGTLTYNGNGSTGGSVPIDTTNYEDGQTATVLGNTEGLTKTGFAFIGWNTEAGGTGTAYSPGSTFPMTVSGITLYAMWIAEGTLDTSFDPGGGANSTIYALALQTDGKILIAGSFTSYNGTARIRIARLNSDGSIDTAFEPGSGTNGPVYSLAVQDDGKILLGGNFTQYDGATANYITRINSDGSYDGLSGTGAGGAVNDVALQDDGKILVGGAFTIYNETGRNRIARLNSDGSLDSGFDPGLGADSTINSIAVQSDEKILIGGDFSDYNEMARSRIARLNADGSLDTSFNPGVTGVNNIVRQFIVLNSGKILLGGDFTTYDGQSRNRIARANADGTLDLSFTPGSGAGSSVTSLAQTNNGKIFIGGAFLSVGGANRNHIARLNEDGTLDPSFDPGSGTDTEVNALAVQADGKVLLGGGFMTYNGSERNRIVRIY